MISWLCNFLASGALVVLLVACAGAPQRVDKAESDPVQLIWPLPPDQPRFAFETALRSAADIKSSSDPERLKRIVTGDQTVDTPVFEKPTAVAARRGRIYVTDSVNRTVVVFDVPRRKVFRFGIREPGNLSKPMGLALDDNMNVYVVDATRRQVLVYDSLGLFLRAIGGPQDFERPTGIAVNRGGDRVYVVDRAGNQSENHCVVAYDGAGRKLFSIGRRGAVEGQFNMPVQGAVAPDGTLYVLDAGNFRIQAFDPDGRFLGSFGKVGAGFGDFARPRGIAVDAEGNVYVTDSSFGNFQIFNARGELLLAVGRLGKADKAGHYALPSGIAVDETGRVYVVDQFFNKVEVFRRLSDKEGKGLLREALR